jgi:hypothetical protein
MRKFILQTRRAVVELTYTVICFLKAFHNEIESIFFRLSVSPYKAIPVTGRKGP